MNDTFDSPQPSLAGDESQQAARVTWLGTIVDALLGALKVVVGVVFHSHALVADGVHSFSDVASDLVVLGVMHFSRQAPDLDHPYGHQRFETMGTVLLGTLLIAVAGALAWDSAVRLWQHADTDVPDWPVLAVALASVLSKEAIFQYTRHVGLQIRSELIVANAWHSRTDALSSVIVFIAAIGAMLGYPWLDGLAAIAVSVFIGRIGWDFAWNSIKELVDTALAPEETEAIRDLAMHAEGVRDVHCVRSRRMGGDVLLEIHLQVDPSISVSEGHQIGITVTRHIIDRHPRVRDVTFHIDAEDDGNSEQEISPRLPMRKDVVEALRQRWGGLIDFHQAGPFRLHYLGDKVSVELFLRGDNAVDTTLRSPAPLATQLRHMAADLPWLGQVRVWYAEQSE